MTMLLRYSYLLTTNVVSKLRNFLMSFQLIISSKVSKLFLWLWIMRILKLQWWQHSYWRRSTWRIRMHFRNWHLWRWSILLRVCKGVCKRKNPCFSYADVVISLWRYTIKQINRKNWLHWSKLWHSPNPII